MVFGETDNQNNDLKNEQSKEYLNSLIRKNRFSNRTDLPGRRSAEKVCGAEQGGERGGGMIKCVWAVRLGRRADEGWVWLY
ncbi:hypothetical protein Csa_022029 [Cucumis sativus]|uniref:Uncharacterized protein n=1 Tax=Cucumis sativus TaxID=3659 RepID=A0A0A0LNH2_CUCSA|nr:hypothetical protein Csa_022029 [Cucumis sativus]